MSRWQRQKEKIVLPGDGLILIHKMKIQNFWMFIKSKQFE